MLAHPLDETVIDMADYAAEWKWDGIRVQIVHAGGETRLYSRSRDHISATFPEIVVPVDIPAVLDCELLERGSHQGVVEGAAARFNALQQPLGRMTVAGEILTVYSALVRLSALYYDEDTA